jgi:hypothetical protein
MPLAGRECRRAPRRSAQLPYSHLPLADRLPQARELARRALAKRQSAGRDLFLAAGMELLVVAAEVGREPPSPELAKLAALHELCSCLCFLILNTAETAEVAAQVGLPSYLARTRKALGLELVAALELAAAAQEAQ